MLRVVFIATGLLIAACGSEQSEQAQQVPLDPTPTQIAFAETASPASSELAELYDRSCRLCHAVNGMNAPLTGHGADWSVRLEARGGMEKLLASTKDGFEMMPALGQCFDCSDQQFIDLIEFMAKDGGGTQ